jgi:hypothetical protein
VGAGVFKLLVVVLEDGAVYLMLLSTSKGGSNSTIRLSEGMYINHFQPFRLTD